jgi:hypothetical protein
MRKLLLVFALICVVGLCAFLVKPIQNQEKPKISSIQIDSIIEQDSSTAEKLYHQLGLSGKLKYEAFEMAFAGYEALPLRNRDIITVIDFTLPSTDKRMYVLDLKNKKLLFHTIVSHGRNSGEKYATSFSNRHGSYQSSLGFYITENTYQGGNGYSLVLNGLEKGINDQAKPRAVVIHGADYCSQQMIKATGRLGRSYGCPALPREVTKPIINMIKDGTMLFIYADSEEYLMSSTVLKPSVETRLAQRDLPDVELPGKAILN